MRCLEVGSQMRRQQRVSGRNAAFTITDEAKPNGQKSYRPVRFATLGATIPWLKRAARGGKASTIFSLPLRTRPRRLPAGGISFSPQPIALLAADYLGVVRRFVEKAPLHHPIDFLFEFIGPVALHADEFGHHAAGALVGSEIAQHFVARAILVLAQPGDRAIKRAAKFCRCLLVYVRAGDGAAAPAQVGKFAGAGGERAADQRLH